MSKTLRLHFDATLAQLFLLSPATQLQTKNWYIPKLGLVEGVQQFLTQIPEVEIEKVILSSSYGQHILDRKAGEAPALLVTAGFESWPFVRQPKTSISSMARPRRAPPLLSSDFPGYG